MMALDRFSLYPSGLMVPTHDGPWVYHDVALARIADLEAQRDAALEAVTIQATFTEAAHAAGYRAGVEAAADKIMASVAMLRNMGIAESADAIEAASADIRALLDIEAAP